MPEHHVDTYLAPGTSPDVERLYAAFPHRAGDAAWGFEDELVFVDIETTGWDRERDAVIEVAAVAVRGPEVLGRFETLIDPGVPIPHRITALTGIDDAMVAGAPSVIDAVTRLAEFVAGRDLVAHNCSFDESFLALAAGRAGVTLGGTWLDSLELSRIALPRMRSHRLADLASAFDLPRADHRAAADAEATFRLWRVLLCGLEVLPDEVLRALAGLSPQVDWPLRRVLAHHAAGRKKARSLELGRLRHETHGEADRHTAFPDADEVRVRPLAEGRAAADFGGGGLARRMYPHYEPRDAQVRMAEAVADAFASRTTLVVEAGTGVGKSVAYLAPAARFALASGIGVGVATRTNALLDQLVYSELPALVRELGAEGVGGDDGEEDVPARRRGGAELRYVALKGYEHYPCLRKLDRFLSDTLSPGRDGLPVVAALVSWIAQTAWDDLDSLSVHWPDRAFRDALVCSPADCTRERCRFFPSRCYLHGSRIRAASAHIVVTNHALLFRHVGAGGEVLPPIRYWIVDEAQGAETEARRQLSLEVSRSELRASLAALGGVRDHGGGLAAALTGALARLSVAGDAASLAARIAGAAPQATTVADSFFGYLAELDSVRAIGGGRRSEVRLAAPERDSAPWGLAVGIGRKLAKRLRDIADAGAALLQELRDVEGITEERADLRARIMRIEEQLAALDTFLDGEDDGFVYIVRGHGGPEAEVDRLTAARLDVGPDLQEQLYPNAHSVVFTSATLAVGDDFGHFLRGVGLEGAVPGSISTLLLESPYDYENQMAVFVPTDMPDPRSTEYLERMGELLEGLHDAMGGSVLSLFTNRRHMEQLYDRCAPPLRDRGIEVRVQEGRSSVKRLREEFVADEKLSLFATRSFWEGFDARGDTLRCVVISRLPFRFMHDPVLLEIKERDPGWFEHVYLPEAALELKQAAGRLIRSATDEGCVVICDSRLVSARYAPTFIEALPVRGVEALPIAELVAEVAGRFGR